MRSRFAILACMLFAVPAAAAEQPWRVTGDTRLHDPSIIAAEGRFAAFSTGQQGATRGAILVKTSADGHTWVDAGSIGRGVPGWARSVLGFQPQNVWAPSVSRRGGIAYLYYSLSVFGINTSAIGLMTHDAFDPRRPGEGWDDRGPVVTSGPRDDFNAIDPWRIDTTDGRAWLAYGSHWSGIKLQELEPVTGMLLAPDEPRIAIASRGGAGIEAPSLIEREGRFYLFVSFDQCCRGLDSTYNIRVGRADTITGPYVDSAGRPMLDGGGDLLLGSSGRHVGPGGQEVVVIPDGALLAFHYYDGDERGLSRLQLLPLHWTDDGWPQLGPLPE